MLWRGHTSAEDSWLLLEELAHCQEKVAEYDGVAPRRRAARRAWLHKSLCTCHSAICTRILDKGRLRILDKGELGRAKSRDLGTENSRRGKTEFKL